MSVLSAEQCLRVVAALVQGNSISATVKMTGVAKTTILRLLKRLGPACDRLHNARVRELRCHYVELDEQWSFIAKKDKRRTDADPPEVGDVFTYTALDRNTRLVIAYRVGKREQPVTDAFVRDLRWRLLVVPTISMDGFQGYPPALAKCFEVVDAGAVIKRYGYATSPDHKYEPARDAHFIRKVVVFGAPDVNKLSTSLVERYHLTMRHMNGRKRRLCLAFSRRLPNHEAAVSLSIAAYSWTSVVKTIGMSPAQAAGLTDHVWTLDELLENALALPEEESPREAKPLELRPDAGPARALPGGRGFLRLVGAVPLPAPATPAPSTPAGPPDPAPSSEETAQLDLFAWAAARPARSLPPLGTQLPLFPDD